MRVLRGRSAAWASVTALVVLAGGAAAGSVLSTSTPTVHLKDASFTSVCSLSVHPVPVFAVTPTGAVKALDPVTLQAEAILATSVIPDLGIAVRSQFDLMYVTATGSDGEPAIWAAPIGNCPGRPAIVEPDAELPSVSPDGGFLGFVTLDGQGTQTGVGIVGLGRQGEPIRPPRRYRATSVPPPLPITGIAVGRLDAILAVWGGFVDSYLGRNHPTVGTLDPLTATSLAALTPVFDAQGISVTPPPPGQPFQNPEAWQSSPVYLPNGELLVGDNSTDISLPFVDATPGVSGGGIRVIVRDTGAITSLAAGMDGSLVFVSSDGRLTMATNAVNLPFGPGARTPPPSPPAERTAPGRFTAVAWTEGPSAEHAPLPRVYYIVEHLPSVVGLSVAQATTVLSNLDLPAFVGRTVPNLTVPPDTVLAQDPSPGTTMACQCVVSLTVSTLP